jgi:dUTP pyrophosphatase
MKLPIILNSEDAILPTRANETDAGLDLYSVESKTLMPMERHLFNTKISIALPKGTYGRVAPRSGLALKKGIDVLAGVVDETFRGEIGVILINLSNQNVTINKGDKIAQLIIEPCLSLSPEKVKQLDETKRGDGGFGSTGN